MPRPRTPQDWEKRYQEGDLPWDSGRPDRHLTQLVKEGTLAPGRVLEVGCGTGTNAVWLAQQGFEVVAMDVAPKALEAARNKAADAGVTVHFEEGSFPKGQAPFDLVFDRGCFHTLDGPAARSSFAESAAEQLRVGGHWLSLIGSTDGPPRDSGPPRVSAAEVASAVEPHLEILSLDSSLFDGNSPAPVRMWRCLMQRRTVYEDGSS